MAWTQVGTIRMSEDQTDGEGNITKKGSLYIKLHSNKEKDGTYSSANLKELTKALEKNAQYGLSLNIEKPAEKHKRFCEMGFITEDERDNRIANTPAWLKYEISLKPDNK